MLCPCRTCTCSLVLKGVHRGAGPAGGKRAARRRAASRVSGPNTMYTLLVVPHRILSSWPEFLADIGGGGRLRALPRLLTRLSLAIPGANAPGDRCLTADTTLESCTECCSIHQCVRPRVGQPAARTSRWVGHERLVFAVLSSPDDGICRSTAMHTHHRTPVVKSKPVPRCRTYDNICQFHGLPPVCRSWWVSYHSDCCQANVCESVRPVLYHVKL